MIPLGKIYVEVFFHMDANMINCYEKSIMIVYIVHKYIVFGLN
jgi:hypothetical protein